MQIGRFALTGQCGRVHSILKNMNLSTQEINKITYFWRAVISGVPKYCILQSNWLRAECTIEYCLQPMKGGDSIPYSQNSTQGYQVGLSGQPHILQICQ